MYVRRESAADGDMTSGHVQIGHVFSTVLADCIARYQRLCGDRVIFSTGTDEHGQKVCTAPYTRHKRIIMWVSSQVQAAAAGAGLSAQAHCDSTAASFKQTFDAFNVRYDRFVRTTDPEHRDVAQWLWRRIASNGHIYLGKHEGWYCPSDEAFVPESSTRAATAAEAAAHPALSASAGAGGAPRVLSGNIASPVTWSSEDNYKFALGKLLPDVAAWLRAGSPVSPPQRSNEALGIVQGMQAAQSGAADAADLSISRLRSSVQWGIPVPGNEEHVMYVWLDALANYLTVSGALKNPTGAVEGPLNSLLDSGSWPPAVQVIGKDILKFHAVFWPAFLHAAALPLPQHLLCHAHWTVAGTKMSKSLGNVVSPAELLAQYPADSIRYFLLREGGIANDGDFNADALKMRAEAELSNTLGNLLSRATGANMLPGQAVPACGPMDPEAQEVVFAVRGAIEGFHDAMEELDVGGGLQEVMGGVAALNRYFAAAEPWNLRPGKPRADAAALSTVLYVTLEGLRCLGILLQPAMPVAAGQLLDRLGVPPQQRDMQHAEMLREWALLADAPLGQVQGGGVIFPRAGQQATGAAAKVSNAEQR